MQTSFFRLALVLGLMSCVGPFAIDMYLPALPFIGADVGASDMAVQGTISAYFLAFGVAQLVYGPWADQAGRKPPLYAGLGIFFIGTIICAFSPSIGVLIAGRFVQGLGGAAVMVVPRAIIRDTATGHEATRLMAAIMLVISVSPMLAPLAGSAVLALADWRWIFGVLALATFAALAMLRFMLSETLTDANRQHFSFSDTLRGTRRLFTDRKFMLLTLLGGFAMSSFFVFIAAGPFVYTQSFGLTPTGFSIAFAVNAIGFFAASQMAASAGMRFGAVAVARGASFGFVLVTGALFALSLAGYANLAVTVAGLFCANAFLGLVIPTVMVLALDDVGDIAGLASSLGGTVQMLIGGALSGMAMPFFDGTPGPMIGAIFLCAALAALCAALTAKGQAATARS